jgi:signal peptidase II
VLSVHIIDSVFYGVIFNDSQQQLATLFSDQPYGTWFHGKVVTCFIFLWHGNLPIGCQFGAEKNLLFLMHFQCCDMVISTGVGILIFQKSIS